MERDERQRERKRIASVCGFDCKEERIKEAPSSMLCVWMYMGEILEGVDN